MASPKPRPTTRLTDEPCKAHAICRMAPSAGDGLTYCPLCGRWELAHVTLRSRRRDVSGDRWQLTPLGHQVLAEMRRRDAEMRRRDAEQQARYQDLSQWAEQTGWGC